MQIFRRSIMIPQYEFHIGGQTLAVNDLGTEIFNAEQSGKIGTLQRSVKFIGGIVQKYMPTFEKSRSHNKNIYFKSDEEVRNFKSDFQREHALNFMHICSVFGIEAHIDEMGIRCQFNTREALYSFYNSDKNLYKIISRMINSLAIIQNIDIAQGFLQFLFENEPKEIFQNHDLVIAKKFWRELIPRPQPAVAETRILRSLVEREKLEIGDLSLEDTPAHRQILIDQLRQIHAFISRDSELESFYKDEAEKLVKLFIHLMRPEGIAGIKRSVTSGIYYFEGIPVHVIESVGANRAEAPETLAMLFTETIMFISNFKFFASHNMQDAFLGKATGNCLQARLREPIEFAELMRGRHARGEPLLRSFSEVIGDFYKEAELHFDNYPYLLEIYSKDGKKKSEIFADEIMKRHRNERCLPDPRFCRDGIISKQMLLRCLQEVYYIDEPE